MNTRSKRPWQLAVTTLTLVGAVWIFGGASAASESVDSETRIMQFDDTLYDGIGARTLVMISPPAIPVNPPAAGVVRYVSLTIQFHRNSISPSFSYTLRPMAIDESEAISFGVSALNPARIKRAAAKELSVTLPADVMADAAGYTRGWEDLVYEIDLRPVVGKTWGQVAGREDVQFTVTIGT